MIRKTLSVSAAALMLALPAFAQTTTTPPATQQPAQQQPAQQQPAQQRPAQQQPAQQQMQSQQPQATQQQPGGATQGAMYLERQQSGQWLASNLMDRTVYNLENESIGDVNDVLIGSDGRIAAIVIGVGGFLGIGEKNVAVPFNRFEIRPASDRAAANNRTTSTQTTTTTAPANTPAMGQTTMDHALWSDRNARLLLRTTREDLRNAPSFEEADDRSTARTNTGNNNNQPAPPATPATPAR